MGLAAAEVKNPTRNVPLIAKRVLARIVLFYLLTLLLISFDIPYTYPVSCTPSKSEDDGLTDLLSAQNLATASTATSPFTIIFDMVGSKIGGSFMNTGTAPVSLPPSNSC